MARALTRGDTGAVGDCAGEVVRRVRSGRGNADLSGMEGQMGEEAGFASRRTVRQAAATRPTSMPKYAAVSPDVNTGMMDVATAS